MFYGIFVKLMKLSTGDNFHIKGKITQTYANQSYYKVILFANDVKIQEFIINFAPKSKKLVDKSQVATCDKVTKILIYNAMCIISVKDKKFRPSIPEETILKHVKEVADRINRDMEGKNPLLLAVLNGSFIFAADLMRMIDISCEISFVKLSSYQGTSSTGEVKEVIGLNDSLKDRTVIIVEDIVESGLTVQSMMESLRKMEPKEIHVCTLLLKPEKLTVPLDIEYVAMEIPNDFILGYGLDYDQQGRNLRDIYTLVED